MPPSLFCPDTTWTGTQILLSEQHCANRGLFSFFFVSGLGQVVDAPASTANSSRKAHRQNRMTMLLPMFPPIRS